MPILFCVNSCLPELGRNELKTISKKALKIMALTAFSLFVLIQDSSAETIDDQVKEISYLLMCPVCQGQTVEESNSQLANDMRSIIRKKLEEGKSKDEVIAYFVDRYGETILGSPPAKGTNWILWLLPGFALICGALGIGLFISRSKREENHIVNEGIEEAQVNVEKEYIEKIDKELKDFES